jgi:hypothetical protein
MWVYAALSAVLLLSIIDFEFIWDAFLPPLKPKRLAWVIVACVGMAFGMCTWLRRQFDDRRGKRRFLVPFVIGFALLPVAGFGAEEAGTIPSSKGGFQTAGEMLLSMFAFMGAGIVGIAVSVWALALVHYVRLSERTEARDGPQLVCTALAGGVFGASSLLSALHVLLLAFAGRAPDLVGQIVIWVLWAVVWFVALVGLGTIARARAATEEWLERVRKGKVPEYEIESLSEHPEWAKLPPYLTARSYSGVLVHKPDAGANDRVPRGLVA